MDRRNGLGYVFSLLSGLCYATGQVIARWGVSEISSPLAGSLISLCCGWIVLYLVGRKKITLTFEFEDSGKAFLLAILAGIFAAAGVVSLYFALQLAPVFVASPLVNAAPLFTILWLYIFFRNLEKITFRLTVGCILIVVGSIFVISG